MTVTGPADKSSMHPQEEGFIPPLSVLKEQLVLGEGELDGNRKVLVSRRVLRLLLSLAASRARFDAAAYLEENDDLRIRMRGLPADEVRDHFLSQGYFEERAGGYPNFDPVYYAARYPDVVSGVGTDADALRRHYLEQGVKEWRSPNAAVEAEVAQWAAAIRP